MAGAEASPDPEPNRVAGDRADRKWPSFPSLVGFACLVVGAVAVTRRGDGSATVALIVAGGVLMSVVTLKDQLLSIGYKDLELKFQRAQLQSAEIVGDVVKAAVEDAYDTADEQSSGEPSPQDQRVAELTKELASERARNDAIRRLGEEWSNNNSANVRNHFAGPYGSNVLEREAVHELRRTLGRSGRLETITRSWGFDVQAEGNRPVHVVVGRDASMLGEHLVDLPLERTVVAFTGLPGRAKTVRGLLEITNGAEPALFLTRKGDDWSPAHYRLAIESLAMSQDIQVT